MKSVRIHLCRPCWDSWCKGKRYRDYPPWLKYIISQSRKERQRELFHPIIEFTLEDASLQQYYAATVRTQAWRDDPSIK